MSQQKIQSIRGMHDILPEESVYWRYLENILSSEAINYGFYEIRTPIVEKTALFKRSIGEVTDVVEKEMYTFPDRKDESLSLRPEGTAGTVRAVIQHSMLQTPQKFWYLGPQFRYERPQKGRCRQFHQFGIEAFGYPNPEMDVEIILLSARIWKKIKILDRVELQLNSIGSLEDRSRYKDLLIKYLEPKFEELDEDSKRRFSANPLRILDSKNPAMQEIIAGAPKLIDELSEDSKLHFEEVCKGLDAAGIKYTINPLIVRGLDYYCHTVFEWVSNELGPQQGTVCAGGRYDGLVDQLGGKSTPGVGFAMGLERLIMLLQETMDLNDNADVYMIVDKGCELAAIKLSEELRDQEPDLKLVVNQGGGSFKSQFKKADRSGARWSLILGEQEVSDGVISLKNMVEKSDQIKCSLDEAITKIRRG